jgi:hypothetical protein
LGLGELSLSGLHAGFGRGKVRLLLPRVKAGEHPVGRDVIADIDHALGDLAADPERQIGLDPRLDGAGEDHRRRELGKLGLGDGDPERP